MLFKDYMEEGEEIRYVIHIHPLIYHVYLSKLKLLYLALPITILIVLPFAYLISLVLMTIGLAKFVFLVFHWFYNCWLVTNKGVICIQAKNIWHRNASRTEHEMIAGINYEKKGLSSNIGA